MHSFGVEAAVEGGRRRYLEEPGSAKTWLCTQRYAVSINTIVIGRGRSSGNSSLKIFNFGELRCGDQEQFHVWTHKPSNPSPKSASCVKLFNHDREVLTDSV